MGKVALITGGGSGIGRAAAELFVAHGVKVVIADVLDSQGQETVEALRVAGGEAHYLHTDVSKRAEVESLISETVGTFGGLDFAFNNAGIVRAFGLDFASASEEDWDRVIDVNLKGVWLCMKYEIPQMIKQGRGSIVNMSSIAGIKGTLGPASYAAAKHGVVGLTCTAALQYASSGIRVNAVCPGSIATPMVEDAATRIPDYVSSRTANIPMGRFGAPAEVAQAVLWLCSDAASYVTGLSMQVDGGWYVK